ncbi:MAG: rhodanese-like domain-containing protein [Ignavibacteriaceae bacterium]|nr:rhodanese-like domain-containing protein [Ignavibacteriaceae bacterium]
MKLNYRSIIYILIVASLLGLLVNYLDPKGISFIRDNGQLPNSTVIGGVNDTDPEPQQIGLPQAYKFYKEKVVFFDAREVDDYTEGHIDGAINISYVQFDEMKSKLDAVSKDDIVVTYCGGDDCDLSILLANEMMKIGYKKVFVFFGGWKKWLTANYPIIVNGDLYNAETE